MNSLLGRTINNFSVGAKLPRARKTSKNNRQPSIPSFDEYGPRKGDVIK